MTDLEEYLWTQYDIHGRGEYLGQRLARLTIHQRDRVRFLELADVDVVYICWSRDEYDDVIDVVVDLIKNRQEN